MSSRQEMYDQMTKATRRKLLETALRVFSERTIDAVNMADIAREAKVGQGTIYRYFAKKPDLVLSVGAWAWERYQEENVRRAANPGATAAEVLAFYLESFINLYRNHQDILRFNHYFNTYVEREGLPQDRMRPYMAVIESLAERFHRNYLRGQQDGTLRTDIPEKEMFSATLHLMLAAVTRYAVGLVYDSGIDPETELKLLKDMLMREYTTAK